MSDQLLREYISTLLGQRQLTESLSESDASDLVKRWGKKLSSRGVDSSTLKLLGSGTQGTAFLTADGKVLKVTGDHSEAAACAKLKGSSSKSVVRIDDVFRFGKTPYYGIVQEKLEPLSPEETKSFNDAVILTYFPVFLAKNGYDWNTMVEKVKEHVKKNAAGKGDKAKEFLERANDAWRLLTKRYGIKSIHDELLAAGIMFHDYQAANVMKRNGSYVLIDPGLSKGGIEPDVLEEKYRGLM